MQKKLLPTLSALSVLAMAVPSLAAEVEKAETSQPNLLEINISAILWVLILFCILLFILHKTAWRSVLDGLKSREERIRKDIADAEATRLKAEATLREYSGRLTEAEAQVRQILAQGTQEAEKIAAAIKATAQKESTEAKNRAEQEIEAAKQRALGEIYAQTADLATKVAERIIRRTLNAEDQRQLVQQSLEEMRNASSN